MAADKVESRGNSTYLGEGGWGRALGPFSYKEFGKVKSYSILLYLSFTVESQYFVTNTWRSPTLNLMKVSKEVQPCSSTAIV